MSEIENSLRKALTEMRYTSHISGLKRGLMEHHVDAILGAVMPVVEPIDLANAFLGKMVHDAVQQKREADARVLELEAALVDIEKRCDWIRDDIRERDKVLGHETWIRGTIASAYPQYSRRTLDGDADG